MTSEGIDDEALAAAMLAYLAARRDVTMAAPFDGGILATKANGTEYVVYVGHVRAELAASPDRTPEDVIAEIASVVLGPE